MRDACEVLGKVAKAIGTHLAPHVEDVMESLLIGVTRSTAVRDAAVTAVPLVARCADLAPARSRRLWPSPRRSASCVSCAMHGRPASRSWPCWSGARTRVSGGPAHVVHRSPLGSPRAARAAALHTCVARCLSTIVTAWEEHEVAAVRRGGWARFGEPAGAISDAPRPRTHFTLGGWMNLTSPRACCADFDELVKLLLVTASADARAGARRCFKRLADKQCAPAAASRCRPR